MTEQEMWRPVVGYEGLYEVSNLGKIKSCPRLGIRNGGKFKIAGKLLKFTGMKSFYPFVSLYKNNKKHNHTVHSIVVAAFIGPVPPNMQILHGDGDKWNPNSLNLRIGTQSENISDAKRHGTFPIGSARSISKLCERDIPAIWNLRRQRKTLAYIAEKYGVAAGTISDIFSKRSWAHVVEDVS